MKHQSTAIIIIAAALFAAAPGFAQDSGLAVTAAKPTVDGAIAKDEYSFTKDLGRLTVHLSRTADTLSVGVTGNTAGWVAIGLGSRRMSGSTIFIGYVADGKASFKPQTGIGNNHRDENGNTISSTILSSAMVEEGGKTTLEFALKPGSYIAADQKTLDLIYAMGPVDGFIAMHSFRGSLSVPLK